ncbi:MAG: hypothetical protein EP297_15270 [Gammaproteobacteria bacterium]|nr:MAG: hypothetical protein EP297_15270 [Gammaproteobacteria bacterium]
MRKTDKKIDKKLRQALTEVCEIALENITGFKWLTHFANYNYFPGSLSIICVFETNTALSKARSIQEDNYLYRLVKEKLGSVGIEIQNVRQHVSFDTEEDCKMENGGKWHERFR